MGKVEKEKVKTPRFDVINRKAFAGQQMIKNLSHEGLHLTTNLKSTQK
jgi:hypothetical protein